MASVTLEELAARLERLEQTVSRLMGDNKLELVQFKDWRKAIGLMPGGDDELQRAIDEAGHRIRQAEVVPADTDSQGNGQ